MDKNRVTGAGDKAKGSVKEAAGKVTGDSKVKADKAGGAIENAVGGVADAIKSRK